MAAQESKVSHRLIVLLEFGRCLALRLLSVDDIVRTGPVAWAVRLPAAEQQHLERSNSTRLATGLLLSRVNRGTAASDLTATSTLVDRRFVYCRLDCVIIRQTLDD